MGIKMFGRVTVLLCVSNLLFFTDTATAQRYGDLRLARGSLTNSSYSSGRLEIYINGQWGTVCDDSFGSTGASVACRQMGFLSGSNTSISTYGNGSGPIWLDDVGCTGSESCLLFCSNRGIGSHNCRHFEDVAISCSGTRFTSIDCSFIATTTSSTVGTTVPTWSTLSTTVPTSAPRDGDLRLARGSLTSRSYSSGRLEMYVNGWWGTVCDDFFTSTDANVACRQLGYTSGSTTSISLYGTGSGPIWLDDVGCFGSESCLLSCSNRGIGVEDCTHLEDVAISCSGTRFTSTDCSFIATTASSTAGTAVPPASGVVNIVGIIVGVTVAVIVLFMVIPIIICVVVFCCVAGAAASSSRHPRTVTTTTPAQQAAYPQSYPAAGTNSKQAPPPPYTAQPVEMAAYPPQPQTAYPPTQPQAANPTPYPSQPQNPYPPQEAYPPQGGYPPEGGYPPQSGYPLQSDYPPQSGYPPQCGYPPESGYPPQ